MKTICLSVFLLGCPKPVSTTIMVDETEQYYQDMLVSCAIYRSSLIEKNIKKSLLAPKTSLNSSEPDPGPEFLDQSLGKRTEPGFEEVIPYEERRSLSPQLSSTNAKIVEIPNYETGTDKSLDAELESLDALILQTTLTVEKWRSGGDISPLLEELELLRTRCAP